MNDEQKYLELLKSIGELLSDKERTIQIRDYEIKKLKEELAKAEEKEN